MYGGLDEYFDYLCPSIPDPEYEEVYTADEAERYAEYLAQRKAESLGKAKQTRSKAKRKRSTKP